MQHIALVSHHKTGTSYSVKVIRDFMRSKQKSFAAAHAFLDWYHRESNIRLDEFRHPDAPTIYHIANARAELIGHLPQGTRILHFVRDPRGIILSAIDYHKRGSEDWTQIPREELGGKTYSEHIRSLGSQAEEVAFEIKESSGRQIKDMRSMLDIPDVERFRIEDLSHDRTCEPHFRLARATGLEGRDLLVFFEACCRHALWNQKNLEHVTTGVATDYSNRFTPEAMAIYTERLGTVHQAFGY